MRNANFCDSAPAAASLARISPAASALICPTRQETYFALAPNFSLNAAPKSNLQLPLSCPTKRGVGQRHERWDRLRWTRRVGRARGCRAVIPVSDRTARRRTALKRLSRNFFRQHAGRSRRMARGSCGRQNCVVLAPVAGVKLMEIVGPNRAFDQSLIRQRRRQEEFVSEESAA
jgi:hypothetical protein